MTEKENAARLKETLDYLIRKGVSTSSTWENDGGISGVVGDSSMYSPQYRAALWIATVDQRRLVVPVHGESSSAEYPFLQRYALAVLFFATGGERWVFQTHFLTGLHECSWWDPFMVKGAPPDVSIIFGVICDAEPDTESLEIDLWGMSKIVTHLSLPRE